jgi:hypothetical protein
MTEKRHLAPCSAFAFILAAALPLAAGAQTPYTGTAIPIPGTFEAENFDLGGEGVAYHDNVPGNAGGQYRTSEGVDIDSDPAAGFVVNNFETGEWLIYTVNVAASGNYDIAINASNNYTAASAFHVEIDGVNVTGSVLVPMTGSWSTFQWVTKSNVPLTAGVHRLKLYSDVQYFNVNQLRATVSSSAPWGGTPASIPGTFEAENFDTGGEGVAYHDNVSGNAGGQYRTSEDVDIISDPAAGFVVNNFETGEWLIYTVNVTASGNYDIAIGASNNFSASSAFHVEIDGTNVTGSVVVPLTGSWSTFQWVTKTNVPLTAGIHKLKLKSDVQYFNVNQLRVTASAAGAGSNPPGMLFRTGYESAVALSTPTDCYSNGCWQDVIGTDSSTGNTWPPPLSGPSRFQLLVNSATQPDPTTVGNWMFNDLRTITGHHGNPTQVLYQEIDQSGCCGTGPQGGGSTQDPLMILPTVDQPDVYVSYWVMFQPDMVDKLHAGDAWRVLFEFKTQETATSGYDMRLSVNVTAFNGTPPVWQVYLDSKVPTTHDVYFNNRSGVAVPVGQWFKFEVFWHRDRVAGRVWAAINGQVIGDFTGQTIGDNNAPIDRIMLHQLYSGSPYPIYQWIDDVQIWNRFPTAAPGDAWYDPPYAPH